MRILIVDTYYTNFLRSFYTRHADLLRRPYAEQLRELMDQCFGTADFYSRNLNKLGHEAEEIVANCEPLQRRWAQENGIKISRHWPVLRFRKRHGLPFPMFSRESRWLFNVFLAQVKAHKPDILYVQNISWLPHDVLLQVKEHVRMVVGQHATTLQRRQSWDAYDLILSSLPNIVERFRQIGVRSEFLALGFEASILERLNRNGLKQVVHVGGYGSIHNKRNDLLEAVAQRVPVDFWGYGVENLAPNSPIRRRYHGEAWGWDMYQVRHNSRIVLTGHISSVADRFANNMTLYEATGVGACLVTDMKDNLSQLFEPDIEVVTYTSPEDCVEKIRNLLEHEDDRAKIARAGQERTLRKHTWFCRMQELSDILKRHLSHPGHTTRVVSGPDWL